MLVLPCVSDGEYDQTTMRHTHTLRNLALVPPWNEKKTTNSRVISRLGD